MKDSKKDETSRRDRFKIWIYVGFAILGILLLLLIIGLFYYLFSSSTPANNYKSYSNNISSSSNTVPKTSSSLPVMTTTQAISTNDRSKYMSSLFRYGGGGFRNRLKRY